MAVDMIDTPAETRDRGREVVGEGPRGFERAAGAGAIGGALITGLIGLLFGALNWLDPLTSGLVLGLYGVVFGAAVGAMLGLIAHALRGERGLSSPTPIQARQYDVLVEADMADEARERLAA